MVIDLNILIESDIDIDIHLYVHTYLSQFCAQTLIACCVCSWRAQNCFRMCI